MYTVYSCQQLADYWLGVPTRAFHGQRSLLEVHLGIDSVLHIAVHLATSMRTAQTNKRSSNYCPPYSSHKLSRAYKPFQMGWQSKIFKIAEVGTKQQRLFVVPLGFFSNSCLHTPFTVQYQLSLWRRAHPYPQHVLVMM